MERCRFSYVIKNIDYQCRETILQTNQLFIENKIVNNDNNNSDNGNFERDNYGQSIVAHDDSNNIAENNLNLDSESDVEHQQNHENNEYSDIPSDYYEEAIIDDNKSNCDGDDDDDDNNDNYQSNEESHGIIIKDEIDIEETYLTIENNFEYEDHINKNNHHASISVGDSNNEIITYSDNQVNDSVRYCSEIVDDRSNSKEFLSIDTGSNKDQIIQKDNSYSIKAVDVDDNRTINDNTDKNLVVNKQDCKRKYSKGTGFVCQKREKLNRKCKNISINDEHLQCNSSDKKFTRKVHSKQHVSAHKGKKTHKCNICGRKFTRKRDLKQHLCKHNGKKTHKCNLCNKIYTIKTHFKKHLLKHNGENLHPCNNCSKRFAWKSHLKRHLLTHIEKSHQCNSCNKKFASESLLKRHLLVHTGVKTHICNICDKQFTWKWYLKKHLLTHIGEKPHQCKICDTKFTME